MLKMVGIGGALGGMVMRWFTILLVFMLWAMGAGGPAAAAPDMPQLTGDVVLTVNGLDQTRFPGGEMQFDVARLKALGETQLTTSTIWTDGVHEFTGCRMKDLTDFLGLTSGSFKAVALNDYTVVIPMSDAEADGPILAYAMDGVPMSVRDKGPLWIVYPFDAKPEYRSEVIYTRAIWQLVRFEVNP